LHRLQSWEDRELDCQDANSKLGNAANGESKSAKGNNNARLESMKKCMHVPKNKIKLQKCDYWEA